MIGLLCHARIRQIFLFLTLFLSGCIRSSSISAGSPVGSLWEAPVTDGVINWKEASQLSLEQHAGLLLVKPTGAMILQGKECGEGDKQDDIQVAIRKMAEVDNDVAVIGSTTNEATVRAASLVNFFNIPMIIPTANGDNLLPSNNLWAFRLSAPGSDFAEYLFGSVLAQESQGSENGITLDPDLKIAIIYEQNTFGESAAVAAAQAAMKQLMKIVVYRSFPANTSDVIKLNEIASQMQENNVKLAYLITSNPEDATALVRSFAAIINTENMPVLVGQSGGFSSRVFLESAYAENVYVLRQSMVTGNCPQEVKSVYEGQMVAAVYLLEQAIEQAKANMPVARLSWVPVVKVNQSDETVTLREKIRDALKVTNMEIPCMGKVAFDNTGQNKLLTFEIIMMRNGTTSIVTAVEFKKILQEKSSLPVTSN
jgi:ABC-type branched-subunit amino acid transport system substrate-binding protein